MDWSGRAESLNDLHAIDVVSSSVFIRLVRLEAFTLLSFFSATRAKDSSLTQRHYWLIWSCSCSLELVKLLGKCAVGRLLLTNGASNLTLDFLDEIRPA